MITVVQVQHQSDRNLDGRWYTLERVPVDYPHCEAFVRERMKVFAKNYQRPVRSMTVL